VTAEVAENLAAQPSTDQTLPAAFFSSAFPQALAAKPAARKPFQPHAQTVNIFQVNPIDQLPHLSITDVDKIFWPARIRHAPCL